MKRTLIGLALAAVAIVAPVVPEANWGCGIGAIVAPSIACGDKGKGIPNASSWSTKAPDRPVS